MHNAMIEHWNSGERELPGTNCIAYPDGRVVILHCYSVYDPHVNVRELFCKPLCDTTIDSVEHYGNVYWVRVDEWTSIDYQGGKIYGGDGQMGNEGFIASVDQHDNLVWGMFFTGTNPIKGLEIHGRTLIAMNEHSELQIEVNLDALTEIKIVLLQ